MELRQMRYFLAVAEALHFRRAAEALHLAQPSLSQQIRSMEEDMGVKLFRRTNRKVQLTKAGETLLPRVRGILQTIDQAEHETQRVDQGFAGLLTVSFVSSALVGILPQAMKDLEARVPGIDLQLKECDPQEQIAEIQQGKSDVGFMHAKLEDGQLASRVIQRDRLLVALPSAIAVDGPVDLREFRSQTAITPMPFTVFGFFNHVQRAYQLAGVAPEKTIYTNLIIGGIHLVSAGIGIALVPESFRSIQVPGVVYRPLLKTPPPVELLAVWRRDSDSKLLHRFLSILGKK